MDDLSARLPEQLSPSRAADFVQCPRLFYYKTIEKLSSPATAATTKGTLAHFAAERIFDHPREERTIEAAVPYVREHWKTLRDQPTYEVIVGLGEDAIEEMLKEAEQLVANWFSVERPSNFDPVGREMWVHGEIGGCRMRGVIDRVDDVALGDGKTRVYVSDYKGLALDTALPTPDGWTTMGEARVGDAIFGSDGNPCTVTAKSPIFNRPCYRITFDEGSSIVCDNEHLWAVSSWSAGKRRWEPEVLSADDLNRRWVEGERPFIIPNGVPLVTREADLPIDPYLLGCWLGDGTTKSGTLTVGNQDISHFVGSLVAQGENVVERAERPGAHTISTLKPRPETCSLDHDASEITTSRRGHIVCRVCNAGVKGFRTNASLGFRLSDIGVLHNKHVPSLYLRSSTEQRHALLQGLMDTDGHWNPLRRQAVFTNTNKQIVDSVYELVCSLGGKANIFRIDPKKETHAVAYMLMFSPNGFNPFRLARKARSVRLGTSRSWRRAIRSIEVVESVPTQCIQVNSPNSLYLAGAQMVPTHNSGKVPKPQYAKDAFFAMNIYTELLEQEHGITAEQLRLVYIKNGNRDDVKRQDVTPESRARTVEGIEGLWGDITAAARIGEFPPRTSVLCGWCHFQDICPAFANENRIF